MVFKEKIVTRGWEGDDMIIREFPVELAILGLKLQREADEEYPNWSLTINCVDVIVSFLEDEDIYIASFVWRGMIEEVLRLAQKTRE